MPLEWLEVNYLWPDSDGDDDEDYEDDDDDYDHSYKNNLKTWNSKGEIHLVSLKVTHFASIDTKLLDFVL